MLDLGTDGEASVDYPDYGYAVAKAIADGQASFGVALCGTGIGISIAVMVVAAFSAFAGPRGVWLSDGIGLCIVLLADSAVQAGVVRAPRPNA